MCTANGFLKQEGWGGELSSRSIVPDPGRAFFGACGCFGAAEYNRLGKVAGAGGGAGACLVVAGNQLCLHYFTPVRTR
ncbi:LOW QUALITY PROTEIN: conserved hypothetical protein [Aspergillus udagawae]|uniref:Uncharacterized protein n=1 Tax=Aspergillus udagawae TaxID=91492 RepID=A0A8H3NFY2_9EURO|nr:LOW QUALITY PROTEIN: conserved hypothetical protein [Aspergillus udagawae]